MKRTKNAKTPPTLPREQMTFEKNAPWGRVYRKKYTGKIENKGKILFSLSVPFSDSDAFGECEGFLQEILENYLLFLEEKSRNTEETLFGGLSFSMEEDGFWLTAALCPSAMRHFRPVARFFLTAEGKLRSVQKKTMTAARFPFLRPQSP